MSGREVDGKLLTLAASGWLHAGRFVLYDKETENMWYPRLRQNVLLTCVAGRFADRVLPEYPSFMGHWGVWKARHPDSEFMKWP